MKREIKGKLKFVTYSLIVTLGINILLPVIVSAEAVYSNIDNIEIDSANLQSEIPKKELKLKEVLNQDDNLEKADIVFLDQITLENNEGNLVVAFYDGQDNYKFDVTTYKGKYDVPTSTTIEGQQQIIFLKPSTETVINVTFINKVTYVQYDLTITLKSEMLNDIKEDVSIQLHKKEFQADRVQDAEMNKELGESEDNKSNKTELPVESQKTLEKASAAKEKVNESNKVLDKSTMDTRSILSSVKMTAVDGIYKVMPGDTLNNIAKGFNISLAQLATWNHIEKSKVNSIKVGQKLAVSKLGVESRLDPAEKNKILRGSTEVFEKQEFIDYIAPYAVKVANLSGEEPLYASVIIAQAFHESRYGTSGLSNPPNHNLTGIKGNYKGEYVKSWTWEHDASFQADVNVLAEFRKYPSYYEALLDHAKKMRYGTTWNDKLYAGTWIKNTTSYRDATNALDGVYATDPYGYAQKLNNIIEQYHLTDYDKIDSFLTRKNTNYTATVKYNNHGIYTLPYGMKDAVLYTSHKYNNKEVRVVEEATTQKGAFVKLVDLKDNGTLGWIRKTDIKVFDTVLSNKEVDYNAVVLPNNEGIYTKPYGTKDAILYTSYKFNNQEVKVVEEATTKSGTFAKLVTIKEESVLGWIKTSDIKTRNYDNFLTRKDVEYYGIVLSKNSGIYTLPYGMRDAVLYTSYKYNNKKVKIVEEAITQSGTYLKLASLEDNGTLGWIKKSDVNIYDGFLTTKKVEYYATVKANNEGIYTKPKGLPGAVLYTSYKYNNKKVKATEETTTARGTFVKLVSLEDNGTLGWIKKSDVNIYDGFLTTKKVEYYATVKANNEGIYTKPKGLPGAVLYTSYKYNNKKVKATEETTTARGTFVKLVSLEDNGTLGWIKKSDVKRK